MEHVQKDNLFNVVSGLKKRMHCFHLWDLCVISLENCIRTCLEKYLPVLLQVQKIISSKAPPPPPPESKATKYKVMRIPGDGRCFWSSWLSTTHHDEWWSLDRNNSGFAINSGRQKCEEQMSEQLLNEVMSRVMSFCTNDWEFELCKSVMDRVALQFWITQCFCRWYQRWKRALAHGPGSV